MDRKEFANFLLPNVKHTKEEYENIYKSIGVNQCSGTFLLRQIGIYYNNTHL